MIRPYRESDLEDVLEVWYHASVIAHPFLSPDFLAAERESIRSEHLRVARSWVYEERGRAVGFLAMIGNEIGGLFVHPESQSRGIGRALLDSVRADHGTLEVDVFEANHIGRSFYDKYGFVLVRRHTHEQTGHVQLRLRFDPSSRPRTRPPR